MVYNCCSGDQNPLLWGDLERWGYAHLINNPLNDVIWYPGGSFKSNRAWNNINDFFVHYVPAYLVDIAARVAGKKPMWASKLLTVSNNCIKPCIWLKNVWFDIECSRFTKSWQKQQLHSSFSQHVNGNLILIIWWNYTRSCQLKIRSYSTSTSKMSIGQITLESIVWECESMSWKRISAHCPQLESIWESKHDFQSC